MMDKEFKIEAKRQYFKYFRIWFIVIGVLAVITVIFLICHLLEQEVVRSNNKAPSERVYDQAEVLTEGEEQKLRALIAEAEEKIKADIVLVTSNVIMEDTGAVYGGSWETNMMNTADDFYDQNGYGFDQPCGDGVLLLDNWYAGQAGSWLSTCGRLVDEFSMSETDRVLDAVYYGIEYGSGAYEGYRDGIEEIVKIAGGETEVVDESSYWLGSFGISTIAALIYIFTKLRNKEGEKTVVAGTYVEGSPVTNIRQDQFIRRVVTRRKIPRQSTSSGGGHSSGGSRSTGSHRSSGGVRHGGGGRRR